MEDNYCCVFPPLYAWMQVRGVDCGRSRCYLMWFLQHYASVVGVNNLKDDIQTISNLVSVLYPEREVISYIIAILLNSHTTQYHFILPKALPVPDTSGPQCVFELAAAGVLTLLKKKVLHTRSISTYSSSLIIILYCVVHCFQYSIHC